MDMHVHLKMVHWCVCEEVHRGERRMATKAPDFRGNIILSGLFTYVVS